MPDAFDDDLLEAARRELNAGPERSVPRLFEYACRISEIPPDGRRGRVIRRENDEIALFLIQGEVYAISNICPHEMSPVLAAGFIDCAACKVACPLHGWIYDIATGKRLDGPGSVPRYEVKIAGDEVWLSTEPATE